MPSPLRFRISEHLQKDKNFLAIQRVEATIHLDIEALGYV
jgi:hypothetical protein